MSAIDIIYLCLFLLYLFFLLSHYRLKRDIDFLRDDNSWLGQERVRLINANYEEKLEYQSQINQLKENINLQRQRTDLLARTIGEVNKKLDRIKDIFAE